MSQSYEADLFTRQASLIVPQADEQASLLAFKERGAVFTRPEVVNFILDLVGYTIDKPLHKQRMLEPSCGEGDFLLQAIQRLLTAWKQQSGLEMGDMQTLSHAVHAVEVHEESYIKVCSAVYQLLISEGIDHSFAQLLLRHWVRQDDYLLCEIDGDFEYVVGNPPYVRQESLPPHLVSHYRTLYTTFYDRADIYIPFIERSLRLLSPEGKLGFICADRWMKNRYGGPLRKYVSSGYSLDTYVNMTDTPAFYQEVSAYPAITVISRGKQGVTRLAHRPVIDRKILQDLSRKLLDPDTATSDCAMYNVVSGSEPWILDSSDQLALLRRLEASFPMLEEASCKVGIGVATGADKVFIVDMASVDIETERLLPLVATRDIRNGTVEWKGKAIINPFQDNGRMVSLKLYPQLQEYLKSHKSTLVRRHCAKRSPDKWFRTIDRIWPELATIPKLLIPDIKGNAHVVYEDGTYYPHHNLYYVLSSGWDLRALQAVLLSRIAKLFVASYSTKMRGGYIRFQAQYIRRIRIPYWKDVPEDLRVELKTAAQSLDLDACNRAVFQLYGLNHGERSALGGNGA